MKLTEQQVQVAQGALFLIDNIGQCPPNTVFRDFTNRAISEHLRRHTYYYQQKNQPGSENRILATSRWIRRYMNTHWMRKYSTSFPPQQKSDDFADTLFRYGSTESFPADVLSSCEYDKATFSEADLPGYTAQDVESEHDEDAPEARAQQSGNMMKPQPEQAGAGSFDHHTTDGKRSGYEYDALQQPPYRPSIASGKRKHEEEDLGGSNGNDIVAQPSVRKKRKTPTNLGTNFRNLQSVNTTESEQGMLTGGSVGLRAAGGRPPRKATPPKPSPVSNSQKSLETANDGKHNTSGEENEDEAEGKDDNDYDDGDDDAADRYHSDAKQNVDNQINEPELELQTEESASLPAVVDPTAAEEMANGAEAAIQQVEPPKKRGRGRPKKAVPPTQTSFPSVVLDSGTSRSPSHTEKVLGGALPTQQSRASPSSKSGKRKHGDADLVDSSEEQVAAQAPATKKSKTTFKFGRHAIGSEEEVQDSQSLPPAVPNQNFEQQTQPAPFDIEKQGQEFGRFYHKTDFATIRVLASIGEVREHLCPLDETPSKRLEALYRRCWGPDWQNVRVKLTRDSAFVTADVMMSVISAYLFENVLNQQASIQEVQAKLLELKGTMGEAILRTLDLENEGHNLAEVARAIESENARITLAEGEKSGSLQRQLHAEAEKFAKELWDIIVPHFRGLSRLARGYGMSSNRPEREWHEVFDEHFIGLIEEILHFRLKLLATGCEQVYTWPEASEEFDLRYMYNTGAQLPMPLEVLSTAFPGFKVRPPGSSKMLSREGLKAMVKVKEPSAT